MWIVTVKIDAWPNHNPYQKKVGICPVNGGTCTDVSGAHHSILARNAVEVAALRERYHVTRVEEISD